MREFFASGHVADLILAIMAVEFVAMAARATGTTRRRVMADLLYSLGPGACLLLALRAALTGAGWISVAAWLTLALPVHIGDLVRRRR